MPVKEQLGCVARHHSSRLTTIIQTRVAPRGTLSTQRIQYPRFGLGGPIESTRHEFGGHSLAEQNLDILRAGARVSRIDEQSCTLQTAGLATAVGPRVSAWEMLSSALARRVASSSWTVRMA